ncbi:MAG: GFA family protein [Nevskiaceae bacterium]|nr:MAG: GFA family protein [Nevskiaceae bacterium]TBR75095.1 MAG: GFA family protein [Nevskiaceae bacterium]
MSKSTGSCLCGAIHYECDVDPVAAGVCHCRHCQKTSGSAFSTMIAVPENALRITGTLSTYEDRGDDGGRTVLRKFCGRCGAPIVSLTPMAPGIAFLKAGTLDDVSHLKPTFQCWHDSAQPWLHLDDSLATFPRNPAL